MNYLKKITDEDFGLISRTFVNPRKRIGARGIIFNCDNKIGILFKRNKNEYKLIGGGVDEFETPEEAFNREALEETGYSICIDDFIGIIEEYKSLDNFQQQSYIYVAHVIEQKGKPQYTKQEQVEGSELLWLDIDEAINLIKNSENYLLASTEESHMSLYHTKFIVRRDYEILNYYKKIKSGVIQK